jgi:hypothetical protein
VQECKSARVRECKSARGQDLPYPARAEVSSSRDICGACGKGSPWGRLSKALARIDNTASPEPYGPRGTAMALGPGAALGDQTPPPEDDERCARTPRPDQDPAQCRRRHQPRPSARESGGSNTQEANRPRIDRSLTPSLCLTARTIFDPTLHRNLQLRPPEVARESASCLVPRAPCSMLHASCITRHGSSHPLP